MRTHSLEARLEMRGGDVGLAGAVLECLDEHELVRVLN